MTGARRSEAGLTLIEMMVAMTLFALGISGALALAFSISNGLRGHREAFAAERAVRTSMDLLTDTLRGVSPGTPVNQVEDLQTCTKGAITVTNRSNGPDSLSVIYAAGTTITSVRAPFDSTSTSLTLTDASQLKAGDTVLVTDLDRGHLVRLGSTFTDNGDDWTVDIETPPCTNTLTFPTGGYAVGSLVLRAQRANFFVGTDDGQPTLMMDLDDDGVDAEPLAEGIEDLQIAIGQDTNNDGAVDDWVYDAVGDAAPTGALRALRLTVVARSLKASTGTATFLRPGAEDRTGSLYPDNYRRRTLRSAIELRNLEMDP